jgi:hypothetical protein
VSTAGAEGVEPKISELILNLPFIMNDQKLVCDQSFK